MSPGSSRIAISVYAFANSYIGNGEIKRSVEHEKPIQRDAGTGIVLEQTSHHVISGNTFTGLNGAAITADETTRNLVISGNLVTDLYSSNPGSIACLTGPSW